MSASYAAELVALAARHWGPRNKARSTRKDARFGTNGSKSVNLDDATWYDHEAEVGGGFRELYKLVHGEFPENGSREASGRFNVVAEYNYRDHDGQLLFQVVRMSPKDFRQRRPDGNGGWIWKTGDVKKVLYRLPELLAAPLATVFVVEGEKDVDALRDRLLVATTNPGGAEAKGASKWLPSMSDSLRDRDVVVLPDNDEAGEKHAANIASSLKGKAKSVRIVRLPNLPDKGDVSDWLAAGGTAEELERLATEAPEPEGTNDLKPVPWTYRDPTTIPPRQWLVGTILIRGYATVLGSTGGVGKTAFAIALALTFITGRRDILGLHVFETGKAWLLTLEDDRLELERRIAAAMLFHRIKPEDIAGKLFINAASERPVLLARADEDGVFVTCEDAEQLQTGIQTDGIGLTIVDPMVKSHALTENSNEHMDKLIALANRICGATGSAMLIPHHFRKGGGENGGRDAFRGGGSLIDGCRVARTCIPLAAVEAEAFKLPPDDAFRYVRLIDAKANLAPKTGGLWFQLVSVELGNKEVSTTYPAGDNIQVAAAWQPPAAFDGLDLEAMERVFTKLRAGPGDGWFYSPIRQAKHWAGKVVIKEADKSEDQAAEILALWLKNSVLSEEPYKTPSRSDGTKIVLNEDKISEMLKPLRTARGGFEP
jgi:5S rRNA maturation endonuclease (ribonuclease M5)